MLCFLLVNAEALHGSRVERYASFFFNGSVDNIFVDGVSHPSLATLVVFFDQGSASNLGVLLFHS